MATSLYDQSVTSYLQTLGAVAGFLKKGLAHCLETNTDPNEFVEARLYADMHPLRFQICSVAHHSLGAIDAIKAGLFLPPGQLPPHDYAALQKLVADTRETLQALTPAEINALAGADLVFQLPTLKVPFTAEGFLMSFSLPNFYFHATTAYDILRMKGVPLGKRDFLGQLRIKN